MLNSREMTLTAAEISAILDGEVVGNPDTLIHSVSKIDQGVRGSLSFLANPKSYNYLYDTEALGGIRK